MAPRQSGTESPSHLEIFQDVVHCVDEFLHGGYGFVAHVRDAEGCTFDFAVAAVDQEVVFGFQGFNEAAEIQGFWSGEAGERE